MKTTIHTIENLADKELFNQKAQHPLQSWEWGEARKAMGLIVLRIGEYEKEKLKNVFNLTFHKIPLTPYKVGYLPRSVMPSKTVLDYLLNYAKKNKVIFIKIEPYVRSPHHHTKYLTPSPHPLFPSWTQVLDLTKNEEELLNAMKSKTRYNIRLAEKKGVSVQEMSNEKGFGIFSRLYFDTCKRQKYFGHTILYHTTIWNHLKSNIIHILVAWYNNTPLAAYELFYFKNILYYPYGGSSPEYRNLMGTNLLMWEAIRFGKKIGALTFDMWGSLPPNYAQNDAWAGFTRFKKGYNTQFVEFAGSYDLVASPTKYLLYNNLNILRNLFLRIKKLI